MTWDGSGIDPYLPQRIASEITLTRAERRMYQEWWGSFSSWLVKVHRSVLGSGVAPDASAVWQHAPLWAEQMDAFVKGPVRDTMGIAYNQLFGAGYDFDARPFVSAYLGSVHNRMVRTPNEVYDLVASTVARGAGRGDSIPDIASRVDEILTTTGTERWSGRATTVARSETLAALNAGRHDSFSAIAEETGEEGMEQIWLATLDHRTREDHQLADGQRVGIGEPFDVCGEQLNYPGDPFGSAACTANCRCTTLLVSADEQVDMSGRGFTDDWDTWEAELDNGTPLLPEAQQTPPSTATTSREEKARIRQASIDTARTGGKVAAELDEVVANVEGDLASSAKAVEARIAAGVARGALPEDVAAELRAALAAGDPEAFTGAAWKYAETLGVTPVERAGQVVKFDRKLHRALEGSVSGDVVVVRPGLRWTPEDLVLEKAVVEEAAAADIVEARFTRALSGQEALDSALVGLDRSTTSLTRSQHAALSKYRSLSSAHADINSKLRAGEITPDIAEDIREIDSAMAGSLLPDDVVLYRGIGDGRVAFGERLDGDLTGVSWTERGYVSTTVDGDIAEEFALDANPSEQHVVLRLVAPKGTGAVQLSRLRASLIDAPGKEGELLLQRGLRLRVVKDHGIVDGIRRLDVEVLPATKASRAIKATASKVSVQESRLVVREALQGGTAAQVTAKFEAEWRRITGRSIDVDVPARASADTLREHYEGLLQAAERFPLVPLERIDWADLDGGMYAEAVTDGPMGIRFGATWLRGRTGYLRSLARDVQEGWHPAGFGSTADIALHEFGHLLREHVGAGVDLKLRQVLARRAEVLRLTGADAASQAVRAEIGQFATTNLDELVSEAFLDVMANGSRASIMSREVFGILEEAYKTGAQKAERLADVGVAALRRESVPSLSRAAVDTNPNFGTTLDGPTYRERAGGRWDPTMGPVPSGAYEENCTNVVMAFEMRMRGYAVRAGPLDVLDKYGYAAGRTAKEIDDLITDSWRLPDGSPHGRTFAGQPWRTLKEIDAEVLAWPEGGRGVIFVGKHIFNVVKVRGKVRYVEAQFEATINPTAKYRKRWGDQARVIRLDDLVPADGILQTLEPIG